MKRVLIIVGDWFPTPSPNTNCINSIIPLLSKTEVYILTRLRPSSNAPKIEHKDNITIERIQNTWRDFLDRTTTVSPLVILESFIKRCLYVFSNNVIYPDPNYFWSLRIRKRIIELCRSRDFDTIISVSMPITCHTAVLNTRKHFRGKWIAYSLDPFRNNKHLNHHNVLFPYKALRIEKMINRYADRIVVTPEIMESDSRLKAFVCKVAVAPIPLLIEKSLKSKENNRHNKTIVFAGTLIKSIREPDYFLSVFESLQDEIDLKKWELHIYGATEEFSGVFDLAKKQLGERLILHGRVSYEESQHAIEDADVLLNIGNSIVGQVPSKIFEYMSLGKPIIHVMCIEKDTSKPYLEHYPACCFIRSWDRTIESSRAVKDFLHNEHKKVSYAELMNDKLLTKCTPNYLKKVLLDDEQIVY